GLLLVEVHRHELEAHRRLFLQREQRVEHAVRVLAPGEAHHHAVALRDHREVADRLADLAADALGELRLLVGVLARVAQAYGLGFHVDTSFRPAIPATISKIDPIRRRSRDSLNRMMPSIATPTAPIPVQTA